MKYSKYLSALIVFALAGCLGVSEKGVPAEAPAVPVVPAPAAEPASAPAAEPGAPETEPASSPEAVEESVPVAEVPPPEEKPAEPPAPPAAEPTVVPAPAAQPKKTVSFRCGYWQRPKTPLELFIRSDGEYKRFQMFELSFPKIFPVPAEEPVVLYVKKDGDYVPFFAVDTSGLEDCAVILFPDFDPATPEGREKLRIFDFSESAAPSGSVVIYNWFEKNKLKCEFIFREDSVLKSNQVATLGYGDYCATTPIRNERQICGLKLFSGATGEEIYSSSLTLRRDNCTYIFVIPSAEKGSAAPDFRIFKRRK